MTAKKLNISLNDFFLQIMLPNEETSICRFAITRKPPSNGRSDCGQAREPSCWPSRVPVHLQFIWAKAGVLPTRRPTLLAECLPGCLATAKQLPNNENLSPRKKNGEWQLVFGKGIKVGMRMALGMEMGMGMGLGHGPGHSSGTLCRIMPCFGLSVDVAAVVAAC